MARAGLDSRAVDGGEVRSPAGGRDHAPVAGRLDRRRLGLAERAVARVAGGSAGDDRDRHAVAAWADRIGAALRAEGAG